MLTTRPARRLSTPLALIALGTLIIALCGSPPPASAAATPSAFRPGELIVRLVAGVGVDDLNASLGTATLAAYPGDARTYLLRTPAGADPQALAEALDLDLRVEFASPNYIGQAPEANPRSIGVWGGLDPAPLLAQPALDQIGLAAAQQISRGAGALVAIIDTGAQLDHPALAASLDPGGYDFVDGDSEPADVADGLDQDGDGLADDAYGHGTHVAGIVHTVAPAAGLLILRALDADGNGDIFTIAQAIDYALARGARVINLSLGTPEDAHLLRAAVSRATHAGAVVVASAGNESSEAEQYPGASNCALAVGAVGPGGLRSPFSNYGAWVAVSAPGEAIFSAFPTDGYAYWGGTSMAAPFVAGEAALLLSLRPSLNPRQVATLIGGTASPLDGQNPQFAGELGDGLISADAALRAAAAGVEPRAQRSRLSGSCVEPEASA